MNRTPTPLASAPTSGDRPSGAPPVGARAAYATLPALTGRAFFPVAFLARLPFSMITIGTLLLVSTATGSLAVGGLASAAGAVATAVCGPAQGAVADRWGQRRVLLVVVPLEVAAIAGLLWVTARPSPDALVLASAALMGAFAPQVSPLARVRWIAATRDAPRSLLAAMSYESTADEVSFVLGPALVGVLAGATSPATAMGVAGALCAVFGLAFALHPSARLAPGRRHEEAAAAASRTTTGPAEQAPRAHFAALLRRVLVPVLGMASMGLLFGSTQTAVTSFARDAGIPDSAGLLYAVMGLGSAATALAVVALPSAWSPRGRWTTFAAGLLVGAVVTLVTVSSGATVGGLVLALGAVGLFIGPVMVTVFTVGGDRSPAGRSGVAMTLLASANVVGVAAGAALGGQVAEQAGTTAAFGGPVLAAALLLVTGMSLRSRPRAVDRDGPVTVAGVV
ncbi:MFS transporter [Oerskovia flava]|uniref:MFS transporter n=1 Tax=Oerskovia flava TaxID=2986422 RepID=UPI00223F943F|nr:MFS transporter [Oerskovia sp. JB1-3-2]